MKKHSICEETQWWGLTREKVGITLVGVLVSLEGGEVVRWESRNALKERENGKRQELA